MSETRLKLEVPFDIRKKKYKRIGQNACNLVVTIFKEHEIDLAEDHVSELNGDRDPGCDDSTEIGYIMKCDNYKKHLIQAVRDVLNDLSNEKDCCPPEFRPTISIHSAEAFTTELFPAFLNKPVTAVYFGNLQGGTMICHWEVSYQHHETRMKERFFVNFEFDKSDNIITVMFRNIEPDKDKEGNQRKMEFYYELVMRRSMIRRVIVDCAVTNRGIRNRTRLHFDLNSPVVVKRARQYQDGKGPALGKLERRLTINRGRYHDERARDAALTESPFFTIELGPHEDSTIYNILARLRARCGVSIEFASIPMTRFLLSRSFKSDRYNRWTKELDDRERTGTEMFERPTSLHDKTFAQFMKATFVRPDRRNYRSENSYFRAKEKWAYFKFSIVYLIECLLSRGAIVKDQLLIDFNYWTKFLNVVEHCYHSNPKMCETALEKVVQLLDERKRIVSITKALALAFDYQYKQEFEFGCPLTVEEKRAGYQRVRKLIFTPTRTIYVIPEMLMGNRVLRRFDHDGTRVIRIQFRDDDNKKMTGPKTSEFVINNTIARILREGYRIAGRDFGYLGSSNSQMRDHGAYFMERYSSDALKTWRKNNPQFPNGYPPPDYKMKILMARLDLGKFHKLKSISKMMARLGQCFTQSMESGVELPRKEYKFVPDIIGGANKRFDAYTYSDGVGMISMEFARKIVNDMKLGTGLPTCYQFRLRGLKGVVAVNPELDETYRWSLQLPGGKHYRKHFLFRPSQNKFEGARGKVDKIEVVKYSAPVPVALNKPFINILDQVSEKQSYECHRRMATRIQDLLDKQVQGIAQAMIKETLCRNKLKELPRRIDVDYLQESYGFLLTTDPFFRSLVKAAMKYSLSRQLRKEQIQIPYEMGRSMLGVVDETGRLQYGQVFVQFTRNIALKVPPRHAAKHIVTGPVLLTKNPCIVEGDVRVFTAVDVPQLRHHCDVIVFPQHGPRPHPDEMAGSDLDGDEYSVIWDPELLLERNEEAFDFTADFTPEPEEILYETMDLKMVEFYVKYVSQDSIGTISNAFLFQSDVYGLNSDVCMALAKKCSQAVDFTKTGQPPEPLTKVWTKDAITGKEIPPEKNERTPDFHFGGGDREPVYQSTRLVGRLYREMKQIEDVLKMSEEMDDVMKVDVDKLLVVTGWENYEDTANKCLDKYLSKLRTIMEQYGIRTEAELFSGCIVEMRNRISDKDQDDMSFFNTGQVIEQKMTSLFSEFRKEFFEEFGGWKSCTFVRDGQFADEENVLHCVCTEPNEKMKQKASAYYKICYTRAQTGEKRMSFAWLAYDILAQIKKNAVAIMEEFVAGDNPLFKILDEHRTKYCEDHAEEFERFREFRDVKKFDHAIHTLKKYTRTYGGLDEVLFIICEWARLTGLLKFRLQEQHYCLLFIQFATNRFPNAYSDRILDALSDDMTLNQIVSDECGMMPQRSLAFVEFLRFLSSRCFREITCLDFSDVGYVAMFRRGEWLPAHRIAVKTYYNLVFNMAFEELPQSDTPQKGTVAMREMDPFVIEIPEDVTNLNEIGEKLKEKTGCAEVYIRSLGGRESRVIVSAKGTLEQQYRLRSLVAIKCNNKSAARGKEIANQMTQLLYEKIMS